MIVRYHVGARNWTQVPTTTNSIRNLWSIYLAPRGFLLNNCILLFSNDHRCKETVQYVKWSKFFLAWANMVKMTQWSFLNSFQTILFIYLRKKQRTQVGQMETSVLASSHWAKKMQRKQFLLSTAQPLSFTISILCVCWGGNIHSRDLCLISVTHEKHSINFFVCKNKMGNDYWLTA